MGKWPVTSLTDRADVYEKWGIREGVPKIKRQPHCHPFKIFGIYGKFLHLLTLSGIHEKFSPRWGKIKFLHVPLPMIMKLVPHGQIYGQICLIKHIWLNKFDVEIVPSNKFDPHILMGHQTNLDCLIKQKKCLTKQIWSNKFDCVGPA